MKTCNTCMKKKDESEFTGRYRKCKACRRSKAKESYAEVPVELADIEYNYPVCTTRIFMDAYRANEKGWALPRWERNAFILASLIRDFAPEKGDFAAVVKFELMAEVLGHPQEVSRALSDLHEIGAIAPLEKFDTIMVRSQGGVRVKRNWPASYMREWTDEALEAVGATRNEVAKDTVRYWKIVGVTDPDWRNNGQGYLALRTKTMLSTISVQLSAIDKLFHGVDWLKVTATAQQDLISVKMHPSAFRGELGWPLDFCEELIDELQLKQGAVLNLCDKVAREMNVSAETVQSAAGLLDLDVTPEVQAAYAVAHGKALASLRRGQLNSARCVFHGRAMVLHRSNCRVHNKVSALRPEVREYLHTGSRDCMYSRDVNNAGIASAVFKVAHLAEEHEDVRRFIADAKDGTFYQKAYDWLSANGVVFEGEMVDGEGPGKAEVKYGTRLSRAKDVGPQCSGVLPHLYHSGDEAYCELRRCGLELPSSSRRGVMQKWAYEVYPHVYEVIDGEKKQIAMAWLKECTNSAKFRENYRQNCLIQALLECDYIKVEEIVEDFNITNPEQYREDGTFVNRRRMWQAIVNRVRYFMTEYPDCNAPLLAALPSAARVRLDKITSGVSRSIHDAETAGQWQGVLKFKETYPDAVCVSIHDCIMTDTDPDYLAECLKWGWLNCLQREDGSLYGVEVSVDDDAH